MYSSKPVVSILDSAFDQDFIEEQAQVHYAAVAQEAADALAWELYEYEISDAEMQMDDYVNSLML